MIKFVKKYEGYIEDAEVCLGVVEEGLESADDPIKPDRVIALCLVALTNIMLAKECGLSDYE